ncbi:MAG: hypothetical protein FWD26_04990 [Treponema sp.]|nr:hypothetical protein [Treponema sp.]
MIENKEVYGRFAAFARRIKRNNPDSNRTAATAERTLGFTGIIDITNVLDAQNKAELSVKLNNGDWVKDTVDFNNYTPANLTPENAAAALNASGFPGVEFGVDPKTKRLLFKASVVEKVEIPRHPEIIIFKTEIQIKGELAGALDFGQCRKHGGFGCYWVKDFDDHDISYGFAYDRREDEQIDLEGNRGTVTRMVLPGNILGVNFALATKFKDDELTNMIQGGELIPGTANTPSLYIIPNSEFRASPSFTCEIFLPLYGHGTSTMDQITAMERRIFPNCTGSEGDVPAEAKAWANYSYNIKATEPRDEHGKTSPSFLVPQYTWDQYDALHIEDI